MDQERYILHFKRAAQAITLLPPAQMEPLQFTIDKGISKIELCYKRKLLRIITFDI